MKRYMYITSVHSGSTGIASAMFSSHSGEVAILFNNNFDFKIISQDRIKMEII